MSTDDSSSDAPVAAPRRRLSGRSIAALLCSVAIFCPPLTLVGPLLGLRALMDMRRNPLLTGRVYASAAIVIGTFFTAAWVGGAWWWHANARTPMINGPATALRAGFGGDRVQFRAGFVGEAAAADQDPEAAAFIAELERRYGSFVSFSLDEQRRAVGSALDPEGLVIPYIGHFERADVRAQGRFIVVADGMFVLRFASIVFVDAAAGNLAYPMSTELVLDERADAATGGETDQADAE